jgi:ubiquinone/menaquinone biosynthesis C-methylase UbiE
LADVSLRDVQAVYGGPEGDLWEQLMGQQIHIGGFQSSMDLAERAGIGAGMTGIDLCCCNGAGMRFLVRFRNVARMQGVDATATVVDRGRRRSAEEGLDGRIQFVLADVTRTGLPDHTADFVWGEDAWCYVVDKPALIREAVRLTRPGGTIAFTDWVEGPARLTEPEAARLGRFMKFPNVESIEGYQALLAANGCQVVAAEDTGRFAAHIDLYINMVGMQLTYDALRIVGFDGNLMKTLGDEMAFMQRLAHAGKLVQGRFIARTKG